MHVLRVALSVVVASSIVGAPHASRAAPPETVCTLSAAADGTCDASSLPSRQDQSSATPATATAAPARRRDSLKNGAIIGGVIGFALGLVAAGISDCPGDDPSGSCPAARAGGVIVSTALWTGIGIGFDALVADRTAGIATPPTQRGRTRRFPRPSVAMTVRW
jgi:hypothetical protein